MKRNESLFKLSFKRKILCFSVVLILVFSLSGVAFAGETERFDVDVTVFQDNTFRITETIVINFDQESHGIYRYIPYLGYTTQVIDGETVDMKEKVDISDISVEGYPYETYTESGNVVLQIGSEDVNLSGLHTFDISYKVTARDDRNVSFDSFYYNVLPVNWQEPILSSTIKIQMPQPFDSDRVTFSGGAYGEKNTGLFTYTVDGEGAMILGQNIVTIPPNQGQTVNILMPEGYFVGEKENPQVMFIFAILAILSAIATVLLWFLFGRDRKVIKTVEFYPPKGINSSEVGYILDGAVDDKDLVSLVIYWAGQGNLRIIEEKDKKGKNTTFRLEKLKALPTDADSYEVTMFDGIFAKKDSLTLDEIGEEFAHSFAAAKSLLAEKYKNDKEKRIFSKNSSGARAIGYLLTMVPVVSLGIFGFIQSLEDSTTLVFTVFSFVMTVIGGILFSVAYDYRGSKKASTIRIQYFFGAIVMVLSFLSNVILSASTLELNTVVWGLIACATTGVNLAFSVLMSQRTKYGTEMIGKLLGFKEFIRTAELDKLKHLVEENPAYFYNVIPYAYVFGLSDKWAEKFESIAMMEPDWYVGGYQGNAFNTYVFIHSFNHCASAMRTGLAIQPAVTAAGSSGGGNFTSGGGFSGGGMGGGGGGRW